MIRMMSFIQNTGIVNVKKKNIINVYIISRSFNQNSNQKMSLQSKSFQHAEKQQYGWHVFVRPTHMTTKII